MNNANYSVSKKSEEKMITQKRMVTSLYLVLLACLLAVSAACSGPAQDREEPGAEREQQTLEENQVKLSAEAIKTFGLEVTELKPVKIKQELPVPGEIQFNPQTYVRLTARIAGRVEELLVYEGYSVKEGQTVLRLFSLPFIEAVSELKLARERYEKLLRLNSTEREAASALVSSARKKLALMGLNTEEIEASGAAEEEDLLFPVTSPLSGQVIKCDLLKGEMVEAGSVLMEIASLDKLWVEARIQEKDLSLISPGQTAVVTVAAFPGHTYQGQIIYISPVLEASTRTVRARVEVNNQQGELRPGMFAEVTVFLPQIESLAVPEEAVQIISGQPVVFVAENQGIFTVRKIETGNGIRGWRPVLSGLAEGESYVSRGAFILKSELLKGTFGEE
jgi:RND family efflux transporter MFP subunit